MRAALIFILTNLLLWISWPAGDVNDRLGFIIIMTAIMPLGLPIWFLSAYFPQLLIFIVGMFAFHKSL